MENNLRLNLAALLNHLYGHSCVFYFFFYFFFLLFLLIIVLNFIHVHDTPSYVRTSHFFYFLFIPNLFIYYVHMLDAGTEELVRLLSISLNLILVVSSHLSNVSFSFFFFSRVWIKILNGNGTVFTIGIIVRTDANVNRETESAKIVRLFYCYD